MGAKRMPTINSVGRTVRGVRMGCHAFSRCCLKAVSRTPSSQPYVPSKGPHTHSVHHTRRHSLAGLRQLPFSFLVPSPSSPFFLRLKRPMQAKQEGAKPVRRRGRRGRPAGEERGGRRRGKMWKKLRAMSAGGATMPVSAFRPCRRPSLTDAPNGCVS